MSKHLANRLRNDKFFDPSEDDLDDYFEAWEGDYYYLNKGDYEGLLEYRKLVAERNPEGFPFSTEVRVVRKSNRNPG